MRAAALALALALLAPAAAVAQPGHPPPGQLSQHELAKKLFEQGVAAYQAGRFQMAAQSFERAYASAPVPVLLFNVGQAYRKAGDCPRARRAFTRFLHSKPSPPVAQQVRDLMKAPCP